MKEAKWKVSKHKVKDLKVVTCAYCGNLLITFDVKEVEKDGYEET